LHSDEKLALCIPSAHLIDLTAGHLPQDSSYGFTVFSQIVLVEDNSTDVWLVREELWELAIHIELLVISGCGEVLTAPQTAPRRQFLDFIERIFLSGICKDTWLDT
jgi:hypothetical protein